MQIPRTLGVLRSGDLRRHGVAVLTALHRAEHANRGGRLTVVGEPADSERNGRVGGGLVVNVQRVDTDLGKVTKSTPMGSIDQPFNPISVALGAEATFVARTHDMDRSHMQEMFRRAHDHQGSAIVEVFQNCNVFNDGAFNAITKKDARDAVSYTHLTLPTTERV